jgi:hypothetical protein
MAIPAARAGIKGVVGHWWYVDRYGTPLVDQYARLGVTNVRLAVDWVHIEAVEGKRDFSRLDPIMAAFQDRGIEVVPVLATVPPWASYNGADCFQDHLACRLNPDKIPEFKQTMRLLVERYPEVRRWEFWNEPEMWQDMRNPAMYELWYRAFYQAARQANPSVRVAASTLTGWDFFQHLSPDVPVDAVAIHSYAGDRGPPLATDRIQALRDGLLGRGKDVPIWLTEYGWGSWMGPNDRAAALEWTFRWLLDHPWVELADYHMLWDTEEWWNCCFGLVGPPPDYAPKQPAFDTFLNVSIPAGWQAATDPPAAVPAAPSSPAVAHDERYFPQTGYRVDQDPIYDYFHARGGVDTFGFPVSRTFTLLGCPVQFFQRQVVQLCPGSAPRLLNLLDPDLFSYSQVNGSLFPEPSADLKQATPRADDPGYATAILDFVRANTPDTWQGRAVNFQQTYFGAVTPEQAGTDNPDILGLLALEVWGAPISPPAADPNNEDFVYQRFQRGIMHYDAATGATRGLLLAYYLKQVLRNDPALPRDLRLQSRDGALYAQYCPDEPAWVCRPQELPASDLTDAFEPG